MSKKEEGGREGENKEYSTYWASISRRLQLLQLHLLVLLASKLKNRKKERGGEEGSEGSEGEGRGGRGGEVSRTKDTPLASPSSSSFICHQCRSVHVGWVVVT